MNGLIARMASLNLLKVPAGVADTAKAAATPMEAAGRVLRKCGA